MPAPPLPPPAKAPSEPASDDNTELDEAWRLGECEFRGIARVPPRYRPGPMQKDMFQLHNVIISASIRAPWPGFETCAVESVANMIREFGAHEDIQNMLRAVVKPFSCYLKAPSKLYRFQSVSSLHCATTTQNTQRVSMQVHCNSLFMSPRSTRSR